MEYSVEELARISNVSVRTLHYYDEKGILTPAYRKANGHRYYGFKEVLRLTEILSFKEMGFSLKKIKAILSDTNLNQAGAIIAQKQILEKEMQRLEKLLVCIDRKLFFTKQDKLDEKELKEQFAYFQKNTKQNEELFDKELRKHEKKPRKEVVKSIEDIKEKYQKISEDDWDEISEKSSYIFKSLIEAIKSNMPEEAPEVQSLMKEYFKFLNLIEPFSKEKWLEARESMRSEEIYTIHTKLHPKLPEYLYKAMKIYSDHAFA